MKQRTLFAIASALFIAAACGPTGKVTKAKFSPALPSPEEARAISASLMPEAGPTLSYPVYTTSGPVVYSFTPAADSAFVTLTTISPGDTSWAVSGSVKFTSYDESVPKFKAFTDTIQMQELGGKHFLTFGTLHENEESKDAVKSTLLFDLGTEMLNALSFSGKRLADGRIEGRSNRNMHSDPYKPEIVWAAEKMDADSTLFVLTDEALRSDQALEWWFENNPAANKSSKVIFGALPEESTLVEAAKKAKKENSANYRAALFNHRGYTVVVAYRKSSGSWFLAWAEPVCKDKRRDALLNSIYFEKETNLALYYYRGKTTYKYHLSLANGKLVR